MQVVKYKWENWEPVFVVRSGKDMTKIKLFDNYVEFNFGERKCIGSFHKGKHVPCKLDIKTDSAWYCNGCRLSDDWFPCVQCTGAECINLKRRDECKEENYYIYLAAFDSIIKVGISYEFRILERLVEQGADMAAKIGCVKDGMIVRQVEQVMKTTAGIVDRVQGKDKHKMLFADPNRSIAGINTVMKRLGRSRLSPHLIQPEIYDLRKYYRLHNVVLHPQKVEIAEKTQISGTVIAAKGNLVIFKNDSGFFTVNAHDLIGRMLN